MKLLITLCCVLWNVALFGQKWTEKKNENFSVILNPGGQTLGYAPTSAVKILTVDGLGFKDLNKNGSLDKYEDWRLTSDERAKDLASKMSVEQMPARSASQTLLRFGRSLP